MRYGALRVRIFLLSALNFSALSSYAEKLVYVRTNMEAKTAADVEEVRKSFQDGKTMVVYNSYAAFLQDLKDKPQNFADARSLIISGHSTGAGIYENGKTISFNSLREAAAGPTGKSNLPMIENMYAWGCYTAQNSSIRQWSDPQLFPNLKTFSGFGLRGPGNTSKDLIRAYADYERGNIGENELSAKIKNSQTTGIVFKPSSGEGSHSLVGTKIDRDGVKSDYSVAPMELNTSHTFLGSMREAYSKWGHTPKDVSLDSPFERINQLPLPMNDGSMSAALKKQNFPSGVDARGFYDAYVQKLGDLHESVLNNSSSLHQSGLSGSDSKDIETMKDRWLQVIYSENVAQNFLTGSSDFVNGLKKEAQLHNNDQRWQQIKNLLPNTVAEIDAKGNAQGAREKLGKLYDALSLLEKNDDRSELLNTMRSFLIPWGEEAQSFNQEAFPLTGADRVMKAGDPQLAGIRQGMSAYQVTTNGQIKNTKGTTTDGFQKPSEMWGVVTEPPMANRPPAASPPSVNTHGNTQGNTNATH